MRVHAVLGCLRQKMMDLLATSMNFECDESWLEVAIVMHHSLFPARFVPESEVREVLVLGTHCLSLLWWSEA